MENFDDVYTIEVLKDETWHVVATRSELVPAIEFFSYCIGHNNDGEQYRLYSPKV